MANVGRNSNTNHHVPTIWLPACRTRRALSIGVQFVEIRHCSEDLHSCSVFSSVPFRSHGPAYRIYWRGGAKCYE